MLYIIGKVMHLTYLSIHFILFLELFQAFPTRQVSTQGKIMLFNNNVNIILIFIYIYSIKF